MILAGTVVQPLLFFFLPDVIRFLRFTIWAHPAKKASFDLFPTATLGT
jgi:hypothetical protein